ncbi:aldo-keto reductase family 1 member C1-like [Protopterus annectens]|uniref:aldo-keto reductase family 1 member C1-like n=1 Tax=Protopterus annectens TaxID=7888 RepID=UPI001CFADEFF|nr:aldo-keto reductase family 1 member C1-like [Protopterus annectens]
MAQNDTVTVLKLNDGSCMPAIGLGTFAPAGSAQKGDCAKAIKYAIEVGYRHFDGAFSYENEDEVGEALREKITDGTVKREDIFYTGKLWCTYLRPELVRKGLEKSLKSLQFDYIDLFIIHWPVPLQPGDDLAPKKESGEMIYDNVNLLATWEALEACKDAGLVKSIGVSNFNARQLGEILNKTGLKYKPVCNQVECHPYLKQEKLLEFCKSKDIVLVAYSPIGSSRDPKWFQVCMSWLCYPCYL